MYTLYYLDQAKDDILQIKRYIAKESGSTELALQFTDKLREQCRNLATIPGTIGQHRPELRDDIRSFPFGNYVIFFRYRDHVMEIVTIIEGHRDVTRLL